MIQDLQLASANEQKSARSTICQWHSRCIKIVLCEKRHRALHVLEPGSKVFHAEEESCPKCKNACHILPPKCTNLFICSCIRRAKLGQTTHHYWIPLMFSLSEEHNGKVQSHAQFQSLTESVSLSLYVWMFYLEVQLWELLGNLAVRNSKGDVPQSQILSDSLSSEGKATTLWV